MIDVLKKMTKAIETINNGQKPYYGHDVVDEQIADIYKSLEAPYEAPVVEGPVVEAPVVEGPVVEAPVVEALTVQ